MKWSADGKKAEAEERKREKEGNAFEICVQKLFPPNGRRVIQILGFDRLSSHLLPCCVFSCSLVVVDVVVVVVVVVGSLSIYDDDNDDNFKKQ